MKKLLLSLSLPLLFLNASIAEEEITEATETVYATPLQAVLADNPFTENELSNLKSHWLFHHGLKGLGFGWNVGNL